MISLFIFRGYEDTHLPGPRYIQHISGSNAHLTIENIKRNDLGLFMMSTRTPVEKLTGKSTVSNSDLNSATDDEPPMFVRRLSDFSVKVGTKTRFLVEIRSTNEMTVSWNKKVRTAAKIRKGAFSCRSV